MDIIDRYFRTLRLLLPKDQRDDIIRELSEEVQAQVAKKEAALGRRLEADERAAIVGPYGHPLLTAARYRPQRHLIGPVVFPYYWIVLRITLVLVAMSHVLGAAVLLADGTSAQIGQLVENAIATALKVAAWVTAVGAVADFFLARSRVLEKWNPVWGLRCRSTLSVSSQAPSQAYLERITRVHPHGHDRHDRPNLPYRASSLAWCWACGGWRGSGFHTCSLDPALPVSNGDLPWTACTRCWSSPSS